jgi:xylan 1,4-beta-xylosidase
MKEKNSTLIFILTIIWLCGLNATDPPSEKTETSIQVNQSQDFEIEVYADSTNQWTGKRNTLWNSWKSTNAHGYAFLRDPEKVVDSRFQLSEMKNVRIMGGMKKPEEHHWLLSIEAGEPICDFSGLIDILSTELEYGITPAIVLDQVPWALAHWKEGFAYGKDIPTEETVEYWYKNYGYCGPPTDYGIWRKYVKKFIQACVDEFGKEEVTGWMFRVSTEPNNGGHWLATWDEYIKHYDYTVEAVLEVIPNAYIGPGNFIASWFAEDDGSYNTDEWNKRKLGTVDEFLAHCDSGTNYATGETGTRITFLAFSAYTNLSQEYPTTSSFPFLPAFRKARELLNGKYKSLHKYLGDNKAIPQWFAIDVHEYGDLPSLAGAEWLWMNEWMAGMHAYVMDLAYNDYGVNKTSFWFQSGFNQLYPYVRVNQMLSQMEGGKLVKVKKKSVSESNKVKYGAISTWKEDTLFVLIYNFNWDPSHQGTLRWERNHTIDNTITLTISGENIAAHQGWLLNHTIINEKSGNASWYYDLKADLDAHPDLNTKTGNFYHRFPADGWEGPVEDIIASQGVFEENGLFNKYQDLSEIGTVGLNLPVALTNGKIIFKSESFTQSGIQLLKFTPNPATHSAELPEEKEDEFTICPNPSTGRTRIKGMNGIALLQVHELSGKLVYSKTVSTQEEFRIPIGKGLYIVSARTETERFRQKLIITQ